MWSTSAENKGTISLRMSLQCPTSSDPLPSCPRQGLDSQSSQQEAVPRPYPTGSRHCNATCTTDPEPPLVKASAWLTGTGHRGSGGREEPGFCCRTRSRSETPVTRIGCSPAGTHHPAAPTSVLPQPPGPGPSPPSQPGVSQIKPANEQLTNSRESVAPVGHANPPRTCFVA